MITLSTEEKMRIIHNWTSDFEISSIRGSGIYRSMFCATITMNPKYEPLGYYYDTEDEAISTTYEKMYGFVHHAVLAVET